jgi:hypothetical protein
MTSMIKTTRSLLLFEWRYASTFTLNMVIFKYCWTNLAHYFEFLCVHGMRK